MPLQRDLRSRPDPGGWAPHGAPNKTGGAAPGGCVPGPAGEKRQEGMPTMKTVENTCSKVEPFRWDPESPITCAISVPANRADEPVEFPASLEVTLDPKLQAIAANRDPLHPVSFTGEDLPRLVEEMDEHRSSRDNHEEKKTTRKGRKPMLATLMESAKENLRKTARVLISAPDVLALSLPALARNWAVLSMIALPPITGAGLLLFNGGGLAAAGCLSAAGTAAALGVFYLYLPMPFATAERWHIIRCHDRRTHEYQELVREWGLEEWGRDRWQWTAPRSWISAFRLGAHSSRPRCPCCGTEAEPA